MTTTMATTDDATSNIEPVVIAGAGIVGLVLALALEKHVSIKPVIYDQAPAFHDGVGAGIGMYPNGLRVIRDISPLLLARIQHAGVPYHQRKWERHDGTEVAVAEESVISDDTYAYNLEPMGIRRWKLQKILYDAALKRGIRVIFNKKVKRSVPIPTDNSAVPLIRLEFCDGTTVTTKLLLAADGAKSGVRESMKHQIPSKLTLTGTTCLYGVATLPQDVPEGLCLPSSSTTKCHGAFYATGEREQCFQFHMPTPQHVDTDSGYESDESSKAMSVLHSIWDPLSSQLCQEECQGLAVVLADDGWNEKYLQPLRHAEKAIKVPFALLDPPLETFLYHGNRVVLLGDAAHPPVPYLGQGAQQGIEDAGTLAILFKAMDVMTCNNGPSFHASALDAALQIYNKLRVPRTREMLQRSKDHGKMQQKRAEAPNRVHVRAREQLLQRDVFFHETLHDVLPGATYDYKEAALKAVKEEPLLTISEKDDNGDEGKDSEMELHLQHFQAVKS